MDTINHQIRLAARPSGVPKPSDWELTTEPVPVPSAGEFIVAISHLSIDPAMRGWMNAGASYIEPVEVGAVMRAGAVGRVAASEHPAFSAGDHVYGAFGVQEHARSDGRGVFKVDPSLAPLPTYLGTLGMTGLTAYFGLLDVGRLAEGETVVVSAAAGAVGSVAGQIAKIKGCRAVGIAGGPEKCSWIRRRARLRRGDRLQGRRRPRRIAKGRARPGRCVLRQRWWRDPRRGPHPARPRERGS